MFRRGEEGEGEVPPTEAAEKRTKVEGFLGYVMKMSVCHVHQLVWVGCLCSIWEGVRVCAYLSCSNLMIMCVIFNYDFRQRPE